MKRFMCWSLIVLLLGVFGVVVSYLLRERSLAGRDMPAYSMYSEASDGLGEAAHVLRRLGWEPVALTRPVQQGRQRGLLILTEPPRRSLFGEDTDAIPDSDARALLRWVEQGNTLLLMGRKNTALHQALHVVVNEGKGSDDSFTPVDLAAAGGYTEGIERLSVGSRATLRAPAGLPLWWLGDQPGAVFLRRKNGRILVVADARLLTREGLVRSNGEPRDDNVVFLANVAARDARDGAVYFDEYHHGLHSGGGFWSYLSYHGERATLVLVLLVLIVAGWTWAVRLGPAVPTPITSSADAVDYASALARLYQRTGARRLLARTLVRDFLATLTRHLRLRRQALPAEILAAWRLHDPSSTERLQRLLRGVGELRRGETTERQLLNWARAFGEFTQNL